MEVEANGRKSGSRRLALRSSPSTAALAAFVLGFGRLQILEASDTYPYVGCYNDENERAMPVEMFPDPLTLESCASLCIGDNYPYMALQFGSECFCGDDYDDYGEAADGCGMTLEAEPEVEAGGRWTMSVYDLRGVGSTSSVDSTSNGNTATALTSASSAGFVQANGASSTITIGDIPATANGNRSLTVVNACSQTIRVGSTGGRITFANDDDSSETACDNFGPAGVYNSGPMGIGCYWNLPDEENGNSNRELGPGEYARFNLYETEDDTRWSGTIWGSTHCDNVDGCATGVCYSPDTGHVCPAYVGPSGPTTKAEFTLSDGRRDYYDVSLIDGVNLPMMIEPDNPVFPLNVTTNHAKYTCGSPGAPSSTTGLAGCTWSFEDFVDGIEDDLSQFLRMVLPEDYEDPILCESTQDCDSSHICGVHPQRYANGAYKGGVEQGSCGAHIAWVSAGGACAGGWESGVFPDGFPFYCGTEVNGGQRSNLYGCNSLNLAHSGYTPGANDDACGCPEWEEQGIDAPPISTCEGHNNEWIDMAQPFAKYLKKGCPTAYTFPYDDQTSTFDCASEGYGEADFVNTQSYTITFCPGSTEAAMYP